MTEQRESIQLNVRLWLKAEAPVKQKIKTQPKPEAKAPLKPKPQAKPKKT